MTEHAGQRSRALYTGAGSRPGRVGRWEAEQTSSPMRSPHKSELSRNILTNSPSAGGVPGSMEFGDGPYRSPNAYHAGSRPGSASHVTRASRWNEHARPGSAGRVGRWHGTSSTEAPSSPRDTFGWSMGIDSEVEAALNLKSPELPAPLLASETVRGSPSRELNDSLRQSPSLEPKPSIPSSADKGATRASKGVSPEIATTRVMRFTSPSPSRGSPMRGERRGSQANPTLASASRDCHSPFRKSLSQDMRSPRHQDLPSVAQQG